VDRTSNAKVSVAELKRFIAVVWGDLTAVTVDCQFGFCPKLLLQRGGCWSHVAFRAARATAATPALTAARPRDRAEALARRLNP